MSVTRIEPTFEGWSMAEAIKIIKCGKNVHPWSLFIISDLKGNCHEQLTWKRQPDLFKFDSRRHRCKAKPPAYNGPLAAKETTADKRADSVNEKWPENLACCHKRIYLNACAAHDSFHLSHLYEFGVCYNWNNKLYSDSDLTQSSQLAYSRASPKGSSTRYDFTPWCHFACDFSGCELLRKCQRHLATPVSKSRRSGTT